MKILKSFVLIFMMAGLLAVSYFIYQYYQNPCHLPVKFAVEQVDSRFKIGKDEVLKIAQTAANEWNKQSSRDLLEYDQNAGLKIDMVYDQRQTNIDELNANVSKLNNTGETIEGLKSKLDILIAQYENDLNKYNLEVNYYNSQGGAPPEQFNQLQKEKQDLDSRRQMINRSASLLNVQIDERNTNLQNFKAKLDENKNKIITQGLYIPDKNVIDVFTYGNNTELKFVLMHELGHAIGLDHDQNATSLMYTMIQQQDINNLKLTSEDLLLLKQTCHLR